MCPEVWEMKNVTETRTLTQGWSSLSGEYKWPLQQSGPQFFDLQLKCLSSGPFQLHTTLATPLVLSSHDIPSSSRFQTLKFSETTNSHSSVILIPINWFFFFSLLSA